MSPGIRLPQLSDLDRILRLTQEPPERSLRAPLPREWQSILMQSNRYSRFDRVEMAKMRSKVQDAVFTQFSPFVNFSRFKFDYWIEGASQGIVMLGSLYTPVYYLRHDYTWLKTQGNYVPVTSLREVPLGACFYISQPFAPLCDYIDLSELSHRPDLKVILDLAFFGAADPISFAIPDNVQWVLISFTKNLGLWQYRVGMILSTEELQPYSTYDQALHLPFIGIKAVDALLAHFSLFSLNEILRPYQLEICKDLNLRPCNSALAGQENPWSYRRSISFELQQAFDRSGT